MIRTKDIAERAGVSPATVSNMSKKRITEKGFVQNVMKCHEGVI